MNPKKQTKKTAEPPFLARDYFEKFGRGAMLVFSFLPSPNEPRYARVEVIQELFAGMKIEDGEPILRDVLSYDPDRECVIIAFFGAYTCWVRVPRGMSAFDDSIRWKTTI